ncbi:hypothetical protein GURKE_01530 [Brevundimonas phage vB_BpoS-Gurke]|uniref:Uncharacterized protein n=1 Tax=Brevundimonas phage vB_BpoS-Gurke TaxID=2948599 RepID=A0A9E7N4F3_9CAUD|nr:hypothetical protein GURKE_01530 [Brevundimonas phage vB_BpoS-Gurke]
MTDPIKVLPIVQGDWVAEKRDGMGSVRVGRVRQSYFDRGEVYMDLIIYSMDGKKIGRDSPDMGGPKTFEPFIPFDEEYWVRISPPDFPILARQVNRPSATKPGWVTLDYTYGPIEGRSGGYKPIENRTKPKKQSRDRIRAEKIRVITIDKPSNGLDLEIAGLRRAAQEMRDTARALDGSAKEAVIARAVALEKEAEALA